MGGITGYFLSAWLGMARRGQAWSGAAWCGEVRRGTAIRLPMSGIIGQFSVNFGKNNKTQ